MENRIQGYISRVRCFQEVKAVAGSVGAAVAKSGQLALAYSGSPGEIDHFNEIFLGASTTGTEELLNIWRDGETTPSVSAQLQDLVAGHGAAAGDFNTKYVSYVRGAIGGGYGADAHLTIPWTSNIVAEVVNPDASNSGTIWSNFDYHSNALAATQWVGGAHLFVATNTNYPSTDSVTAYTKKTLVNVAGKSLGGDAPGERRR
jgi:hypothetical protein